MTLSLSIVNVERLDNGEATRLVLDRHGAVLGRSPHADWSLPCARNHISGSHCKIDYIDGAYVLTDQSTNGTFVNGSENRLDGSYSLADGDEIAIGHYKIKVNLAGGKAQAASTPAAAASGWGDWDNAAPAASPVAPAASFAPSSQWDHAPAPQPAPALQDGGWSTTPSAEPWAAPDTGSADAWAPQSAGRSSDVQHDDPWAKTGSALSGRGAMNQRFAPPPVEKAASPWDEPAAAPAAHPGSPPDVDVWSRMASTNDVDWARGGFAAEGWDSQPAAVPTSPASGQSTDGDAWAAFLAGASLTAEEVKATPAEAAGAAGALLRQLISGLVVLLEARARAKAELGAQGTLYERDGNNPLKWARSPGEALAQMLRPPERGFMAAPRAVEDSFKDLQAHQIATLIAMQNALRATLDRFSPSSIRQRAETRGVLAKIIPSAREAELWRAYEKEFEGVVQGSDEAFMDVFSKAFREAYDRAARGGTHDSHG